MLPAHRSSETHRKTGTLDLVLAPSLRDPDVCGTIDWKSIVPTYSRDVHPSNEDLEEFLFSRVSTRQRQNIESHIRRCDGCRGALADLWEFIVWLAVGCNQNGETD